MDPKNWTTTAVALILLTAHAYAQDPLSGFLVQSNPNGTQTLLRHVPKQVASGAAIKMAHADAGQMLDLRIVLPSKDQAGLDQFIQDIYNPASPNYHQFLTPEQFNLLYGASSANLDTVKNYLRSQGFTVQGQSKSGLILKVRAPVSTAEKSFQININIYQGAQGETFFAPDANPTIAPPMVGRIGAVVGLDNVPAFRPHLHHSTQRLNTNPAPKPILSVPTSLTQAIRISGTLMMAQPVGGSAAPVSVPHGFMGIGGSMGPNDIKQAYNLGSVSSTGAGQTLAIYELDGYKPGDISTFESYYGLPAVPLTNVLTDGFSGTPGADIDEVTVDIDLAIAVAPGLNNILVYEAADTGSTWLDQWIKIADDNLAKTISCSWGLDEADSLPFYDHTVFSQLAAQGQTVFVSSGDSGAYDNCDPGTLPPSCTVDGTAATGVISVDDPASNQYITGAGISTLSINGDGSYNHETASLYGGGGVSGYNSIPSFQSYAASHAAAGSMVSTTMRNVPDVVLTADPSTLYGVYVTDPTEGAGWYGFWGSSLVPPMWSAFISRVNQGRVAAGQSVIGYLNPVLYQIQQTSRYASDFHDITSGTNSYYPAATGYDAATGLGSFNGANLYNDLIGPAVPSGLALVAGNAQIYLTWTAVSGASSYNVKRATVSGGPYTTVSTSGAVTASNFTDTGLTNGTTYYYVISAVNAAGIEGNNSVQAQATPVAPPVAPTGLGATAGNGQVSLTWTASAGAVSYNVKRAAVSGGPYATISTSGSVTGTNYTDTSLANGTTYYYVVSAVNTQGESANSTQASATPAGTPGAPTGVTAIAGNTQATISFTAPVDNGSAITGYTVTSSPGSITAIGASSPIVVTGLTNGTTYTFTVTATNALGTGLASASSNSIIPNIVPDAPTAVSAMGGDTQATVSFTAPAPNGGTAILNYTVTSSPGSITRTGASSPITVTGLTNGTSYSFTVFATNATGPGTVSAASNPVIPAGLAPAPTAVMATAGNAQATVSFTPPSSNNGSAITGYTVTSSPGGLTASGAASPITVAGLTNGTSYTFTVASTNGVGTGAGSAASNSVVPGTPAPPTTVSAVAGNNQATITFSGAQDNGSAITSYKVTSSPGGIIATGAASPITVAGLTNGTAYTFTVTATNAAGTSVSSVASSPAVVPAGPPVAPTAVTAAAGNAQATVTFSGAQANGSAITGYTVTSSPDGLTASGASSPLTVSGLTNGTAYTFTVTATNAIGTSVSSAASNAVTPDIVPGAPTAITAVAGNTQATIGFDAPAANGGTAIISYTVTSSPGGRTATGAASPISVGGLMNGTVYTFTVKAANELGAGVSSIASNAVIPAGPPMAPTSVTAVGGNGQAAITFSGAQANGSIITGYTVTSSPDGLTVSGPSSPLVLTGLTNGTSYTFTVTATNAVGTSGSSVVSNAVTPTPLAPPSSLQMKILAARIAGQIIYGGASLSWQQSTSSEVVQNKIYRSIDGGAYELLASVPAGSAYIDTNISKGTTYAYQVTACDADGGESVPSNSVAGPL